MTFYTNSILISGTSVLSGNFDGWLVTRRSSMNNDHSKIHKTFLFILILDWFRIAELPGGKGPKGERATERGGAK